MQTINQRDHGLDPVIPFKEAADIAALHRDTFRRCFRRGELTLIRLSPRRIGVRKSEFERWLESRQVAV